MPSGVDWREPLRYEGIIAGLPLEVGMVMAVVVRAKVGEGEGMRGRALPSCRSDMVTFWREGELG